MDCYRFYIFPTFHKKTTLICPHHIKPVYWLAGQADMVRTSRRNTKPQYEYMNIMPLSTILISILILSWSAARQCLAHRSPPMPCTTVTCHCFALPQPANALLHTNALPTTACQCLTLLLALLLPVSALCYPSLPVPCYTPDLLCLALLHHAM